MLKNRVEWVILILLFTSLVSIRHVKGLTVEEEAQNIIANIEGQIRAATDDLHFYWDNITELTRYEALGDIQKSWEYYWGARGLYNIGLYNESLREGYWAIFVSHRAIYRIFLSIAETRIERANLTISDIPSYIPQPTEAEKKLRQASELYEEAFLSEVLRGLPSVEIALDWINGIYYAQNKLYWDYNVNVVKLADEAWTDAVDWRESHEASLQQIIKENIDSVSNIFYSQLLIPFVANLIVSLIFLVPMMGRFCGWLKKKSSCKIIWSGNLWNRKWDLGSIVPTLVTLAVFSGALWFWIQSIHGLSRTYEISIPINLISGITIVLWILAGLLIASSIIFGINKVRWQKKTGLLFTIILVLEIVLSIIAVSLSWVSLGQISHVVLS